MGWNHHPCRLASYCAAILLLAGRAAAGPAAMASLPDLTARADAIVVGSIHVEAANGAMHVTILVERVLKGRISPGSRIVFAWTQASWPYADRMPDSHGLLFLQHSGAHDWKPLPVANGDISFFDLFLPATPGGAAGIHAASSPLDRVLAELVSVIDSGSRVRVDLVAVFRADRSPVLDMAFRRYASQPDPYLKVLGLRGLVSTGDVAALKTVLENYTALAAAPFWPEMVNAVRWYFLNTDPAAIQILGVMAVDPKAPLNLRTACASALGKMHTRQALPFLARLLDDSSYALKAAGVGGLAGFANNVPVGGHEPAAGAWPYRDDETIAHSVWDEGMVARREPYYVGFWKEWWRKHQAELSADTKTPVRVAFSAAL